MDIRPLAPALGAEITGVNLAALTNSQFAEIRDVFNDRGVVVIRAQDISPDDHIAFARRWGEIVVNRFFKPTDTHPEIATVLKEPDQKLNIGGQWHTDHSYDEAPAMCSILHAIDVPEVGGDTLFCSMNAAYEACSDGLKAMLNGLSAWHSSRHAFGAQLKSTETHKDGRLGNEAAAVQDALHPVVIRHPGSGRPCLYVNGDFTTRFDGWTAAESAPLLKQLEALAIRPEHTCRLKWGAGDVAMWDNRAVMHKAINDYHGQRRLMHRITIDGAPLPAFA